MINGNNEWMGEGKRDGSKECCKDNVQKSNTEINESRNYEGRWMLKSTTDNIRLKRTEGKEVFSRYRTQDAQSLFAICNAASAWL